MAALKYALLIFALFSPSMLIAASISGKATIDEQPVAGIKISVHPVTSRDFKEPSPFQGGPTGEDGLFAVELPEGQYYLLAHGEGRFAYYGRNPISVPKEGLENINLLMEPDNLPVPEATALIESGIYGIVTNDGQPVAGAVVMVYTDLSSQLKGLGFGMSAPTAEDGLFELSLPPGTYYLVVRVRSGGSMAGPLRAGDRFGYFPGNPIQIADGRIAPVHIPVIAVPEKVERYSTSLFGNTTISGRLVDASGQPLAGLRALLYDDPTMLNRPLYVSQPTGEDGRFVLSFPSGGKYYLAARNELGGTPAPGELYGRYQGSDDHSVEVDSGASLIDIDIKVEEVY